MYNRVVCSYLIIVFLFLFHFFSFCRVSFVLIKPHAVHLVVSLYNELLTTRIKPSLVPKPSIFRSVLRFYAMLRRPRRPVRIDASSPPPSSAM